MSKLWYAPTAIIVLCLAVPPIAVLAGASPAIFGLYLLGLTGAVVFGILLAGLAAFASASGRSWRSQAVRATVVPLGVALLLALPGYRAASQNPIHDVTTDAELEFPADGGAVPNPIDQYAEPGQALGVQREIYPDVAPLELDEAPDSAFARAVEAAKSMETWEVVDTRPDEGLILAVATSSIFRFRDDVVIRVSPRADGSRVDMRSRSRFGQSDLGANAARVLEYLAKLR